ncbi:hypothetical protein V6N13_002033 [Hibiscus sabdariffa]|uniref:Uncharacterized protein n=1 Tax=Hibiscus sabdariffa TaxID=183260 RepID=A0ABR2C1N1_9ROSI
MYVSPSLICTAVYIRFYWKTKHQAVKKKDSVEQPSPHLNRSNVPSLQHQKSVRTNARKEVLEWDRDDSPHMDLLFPRTIYDVLPSKSSLLEENSKLAFDEKGSSNMKL